MKKIELSPYHKIFYNEWRLNPQRSDYNLIADQFLYGAISIDRLQIAIKKFVNSHLLFHSRISIYNEEPFWVESKYVGKLEFFEIPISDKYLYEYISKPFNLYSGELYRFLLMKYNDNEYRFIASCHHILVSASSVKCGVFTSLLNYYNNDIFQVKYNKTQQIELLTSLHNKLNKFVTANVELSQNFWQKKLQNLEPLDLKFLFPSIDKYKQVNEIIVNELRFSIDGEISSQTHLISRKYRITPYLFGQMIFGYLLYRYTEQTKFGISYPIVIRERLESIYGAQINTTIMPYNFEHVVYFSDLVKQIKQFIIEAKNQRKFDYRYCPISKIINNSNKDLLDVAFIQTNLKDMPFKFSNIENVRINNDFNIDLTNKLLFEQEIIDHKISFRVRYNSNKIDHKLIVSFINCYQRLYNEILNDECNDSTTPALASYFLLTRNDYNQIIYEWNNTSQSYPEGKTVHQLFEEQVRKTPDNIAIVYENKKLTYRELNQKSNQLAHHIKNNYQIKLDNLVALCLDKSQHMVIAIFAVLKAGGAYVPIAPEYPANRINHILKDTQTKLILTNEIYITKIKSSLDMVEGSNQVILALDNKQNTKLLSNQPTNNLISKAIANNLAYVIYTSGTTGVPKGVMLEHKNVVNFISYMIKRHGYKKRILSLTNYTFDIFGLELYLSLLGNGLLVLAQNEWYQNLTQLLNQIIDYKLNFVQTTPSIYSEILSNSGLIEALIAQNATFIVGGEILTAKVFELVRKSKNIYNYYGPTETTIWSLGNNLNLNPNINLIGRPIANTLIYVLDNDLQPLPVGVIGKLYIGGCGVSKGYLNDTSLTESKFIANPFLANLTTKNCDMLYKTGDLGRWHPDGSIEFIGREDYQVKLYGRRIELTEIELVLNRHKEITQSVVTIASEGNDKQYLMAYYTAHKNLSEEGIRVHLSKLLPDFLHPHKLTYLPKFPLTTAGKIDRNKLNHLSLNSNTNDNYIAPRNKLEHEIREVFADILGLHANQIGIHDDFFRLGGTSILAIKLVNKLRNNFNLNIEVSVLYKYKTIYQLINNLGNFSRLQNEPIISCSNKRKKYKLSFAQERLWFITKFTSGNKAYNVPLIFKVNKSANIDILLKSLNTVVQRHEILKTVIREDKLGNCYPIMASDELKIERNTLNTQKSLDDVLLNDVEHIFNLAQELPIRASLYKCKAVYYLSIVVHHIAFDGWSGEILVKDLAKYYEHFTNIHTSIDKLDLPKIEIQYKDFAMWQRKHSQTKLIESQFSYWKQKLNEYSTLNLPLDKSRPAIFDYCGKTIEFSLPLQLSIELRKCAKELSISLYSLLLSGFYLLLRVYSNQDDIVLGTMVSNRHHENINNVVGFFVNALVLRQQINDKTKVVNFINTVFTEIIEAQINQDVPFEKLVEIFASNKNLSRHPIFQVVFGMQQFGVDHQTLLTKYKNVDLYKTAKFDLSLIFDDNREQLTGALEYSTSLFEEGTISGYLKTYQIILKQLAKIHEFRFKEKQINELKYVDKADYKKLTIDYNNNYQEYPCDKTLHQLFEEQVERTPDNIAIVYENKQLTYRELNQRSNQLAYYIIYNYHIVPDDLIALFLGRNENTIIAILAVLKSGGAYVPIAPDYPLERIKYILNDTQPKIVITNKELLKSIFISCPELIKTSIPIISINNSQFNSKLNSQPIDNIRTEATSHNLAYVMYTSGTTGKPKGVMVEHQSVAAFSINNDYININKSSVLLSYSSYAFDSSVFDIYSSLLNGATIVVIDKSIIMDPVKVRLVIKENKVNIMFITTALFNEWINYGNNNPLLLIKDLLFGGEIVNSQLVYNFLAQHGTNNLYHVYGPTETTVFTTYYKCKIDSQKVIPIGKILRDKLCYILDDKLKLRPIGAIGEIYIGGAGVAKGYLNDLELTMNKFTINQFFNEKNRSLTYNQLYKTGDLGRYLSDGNIEYIGRKDSQIKIRGHRIELREIEATLNSYNKIKQSFVLLKQNYNQEINYNDKYLIAYYVKETEFNHNNPLDIINDWKKLYDLIYNDLNHSSSNNFIGWNSSYTGKSIAKDQMCKWRDETVDKILRLSGTRILEIGSGSGLLLFNLIDKCEYYYAVDFSKSAIQHVQAEITNLGLNQKFQAIMAKADEILFESFNYDTIILNSVVQYFPSIGYLENILIQAIDNINASGQIFIGDVRDFRLLSCFAYSVLNFKYSSVSISDIEYFKINERELLISPEYFIYLQNNYDCISYVEILPKLSLANNEMTCYRYDVVLHINKKDSIIQISYTQFQKVNNLENILKNNYAQLYLKYPNFRIFKEYIEHDNLYHNLQKPTLELARLFNIQQLIELFNELDYKIQLYLDVENPIYINIIACKNNQEKFVIDYSGLALTQEKFANKPAQNINLFDDQYATSLRKYLESKLPDYMMPRYIIPINKIPLNSNGKIDYQALPKPMLANLNNSYIAPNSKLEKLLCTIFAQVLNLPEDTLGINDDFFKIGGNSILAIKLATRINTQLNYSIKVVDIFTKKTVYGLASYLTSLKDSLITNLNNMYDKVNMFMIHPGFADSEVYVELAKKLSDNYSCYGINNYNLHNPKKIRNIQKLANFYLNAIDNIRTQTNQENKPYLLLGWSLGGQIALNIADSLEKTGYKNIYVILIDTVYPDQNFADKLSKVILDDLKFNFFAQGSGFDHRYVTKVKNNFKYDIHLSFQIDKPIKLKYTKILLFKAMKKEHFIFLKNYTPLKDYVLELAYNNIDKITDNKDIYLVRLKDSHHFNLLEQKELMYNNISLFIKDNMHV